MRRNVFIFHGTDGHPEDNWFPWLKERLEEKGQQVFVPRFLIGNQDTLAARLIVLNQYQKNINENAIMIGHSRGGLFLFRVLEKLNHPIHAAFFVSASVGIKPYIFYHEGNKFAGGYDFNWGDIRTKAKHFMVYHSDNDPYTCLDNGKAIAKNLGVKLTFIPNAGHLNARSGYTKFEKLLEDIEAIL